MPHSTNLEELLELGAPDADETATVEAGRRVIVFLPRQFLETIDKKRGLIPRSAFIRNVLEKAMAPEGSEQ